MAIIKVDAGDIVYDIITFVVEVLLGSEEKTSGIGKEGDIEGGRGKLCSVRKIRITRN